MQSRPPPTGETPTIDVTDPLLQLGQNRRRFIPSKRPDRSIRIGEVLSRCAGLLDDSVESEQEAEGVDMKTVLDLIGEFASINDEKVRCGGQLPPDWERRWSELKGFYDLLMACNGSSRRPLSRRFSADDIRLRVRDRERLRVPAGLDVVIKCEEGYYAGQIVNLSRGGAFLASHRVLPVDSGLVVFLSNPYVGRAGLFEAGGEVIWVSEGSAESATSRGMGVRFAQGTDPRAVRYQLDCLVIAALEKQLYGVDSDAIAPHFLERECLVL